MKSPELKQIEQEFRNASDASHRADVKVEDVFARNVGSPVEACQASARGSYDGFVAAHAEEVAAAGKKKAAEDAIKGLVNAMHRAKANPQTFLTEFSGAVREAYLYAGKLADATAKFPWGNDFRKDIIEIVGEFRDLKGQLTSVGLAATEAKEARKEWWRAKTALETYQSAHPSEIKKEDAFHQTTHEAIARTRKDFVMGRVYRASAVAGRGLNIVEWKGGPPGFYYLGSQLSGCTTAQEVAARLSLEYSWYREQDIATVEFRFSVDFLKKAGAVEPPATKEEWLNLLNRVADWNHDGGQDRSGGGADERIAKHPGIASVQPRGVKLFPWKHSKTELAAKTEEERAKLAAQQQKNKADIDDWQKLSTMQREETKKNAEKSAKDQLGADSTISQLVRKALAATDDMRPVDNALIAIEAELAKSTPGSTRAKLLESQKQKLFAHRKTMQEIGAKHPKYKAGGEFDPSIRRGLTATEIGLVDAAIEKAQGALAAAKSDDERKVYNDVLNRLRAQRNQILKARSLVEDKKAKKEVKGASKKDVTVRVQDNEAADRMSPLLALDSSRGFSVFATTPAGIGAIGRGNGIGALAGLKLAVDAREKSPVAGAEGTVVNQVDVQVHVGGSAKERPAKGATASAGAAAGRAAGAELPLATIGFRDVIGRLVAQRTADIWSGSVGALKGATKSERDEKAGLHDKKDREDSLRAFKGAVAAGKLPKMSLADQMERSRALPKVQSLLSNQLNRISSASADSAPLVSKDIASVRDAMGRLDAQIAKISGASGTQLAEGARNVGRTLGQLAGIARGLGYQSASSLRVIQDLVDERRDALARLASGLSPDGKATPQHHKNLNALGKEVPGADKMLGTNKKKPGKTDGKRPAPGKHLGTKTDKDAKHDKSKPDGKKSQKPGDKRAKPPTNKGKPGKDGKHEAEDKKRKGPKKKAGEEKLKQIAKGPKHRTDRRTQRVGGLAKLTAIAKTRSKTGLVEAFAPKAIGALAQIKPAAVRFFDHLRSLGHKPRMKSWFSSVTESVSGGLSNLTKKAVGGLSSIGSAVVKYSPIGLAVQGAKALGSAATGALQSVGLKSIADVMKNPTKALGSLAKAAMKAGGNIVKKTAGVLGEGMKKIGGPLAEAASKAWDKTKQVASTIGNGALAVANKTGGFFKGLWSKATGVVGAIGGKIKSGLSSVGNWVGDKAKKLGGTLLKAAKFAGNAFLKYTPLGKALKFGWDKFGKKAWDKTKSFAKVAWAGAKKIGKAAGNFLQSPAGQFLTTGLSIAASFIPGGMLVKAGIGAVMGAIEAVSKGGGWKEALMGAAVGGLEGALPFMKLGVVGKLAMGGLKGGLTSAMQGEGFGGIVKGALGGALEVGGGALFGKFAKKFGGGRGLKMMDKFMSGEKKGKGVLGFLQKGTQKLGLTKVWGKLQKAGPKILKGATWLYDKSGKVHKVLEKVQKVGEVVKGGLEGLSGLSEWASDKLGEGSKLGGYLKTLSEYSANGAEKLGTGLEFVGKVDAVVEKTHSILGKAIKFSTGKNPNKLAKEMNRKRELMQKHGDKLKTKRDWMDKTDSWLDKNVHSKVKKTTARFNAMKSRFDKQKRAFKKKLGDKKVVQKLISGGNKLVKAGMWSYGQLSALKDVVDKGVEAGERIQGGLQNIAMMTEDADPELLGGSLKWINDTSTEWEGKVAEGMAMVKKVQGFIDVGHSNLGKGLKFVGKKDEDLDEAARKRKVYYGLEKAADDEETVDLEGKDKLKKGQIEVAGWVKKKELKDKAKEEAKETKAREAEEKGEKPNTPLWQKSMGALDKWRGHLKEGAGEVAKHNKEYGDYKDPADASRNHALLRTLGAEGDGTGDREEEYKAYLERRKGKKEVAPVKPASKDDLGKALAGPMNKKFEDIAGGEAGKMTAGGDGAQPKDPVLQRQTSTLEALEPRVYAWVSKSKGGAGDPAEKATLEVELEAIVNVAQGSAEIPGDGAAAWKGLGMRARNLLHRLRGEKLEEAADKAKTRGHVHPGGLKDGMVAAPEEHSALERLSTPDGIAGGTGANTADPALPELVEGAGGGPGKGKGEPGAENDPVFERLRGLVSGFEGSATADAAKFAAGGDGDALYQSLKRQGRGVEMDIERLDKIIGEDPHLGAGLAALTKRYLSMKAMIESAYKAAIGAGLAHGEHDVSESEGHSGFEMPDDEGGGGGGETGGETGGDSNGDPAVVNTAGGGDGGEQSGPEPTAMEDGPGDYYIGGGLSARPIEDMLASGFAGGDIDGAEPTLAGAVAQLGGAFAGLGKSLGGVAEEVGGLADEVSGAMKPIAGMAGEIGELVGAKDNVVTQMAGKVSEFADGVKDGAGQFGKITQKMEKYGLKTNEFAHKWEKQGLVGAAKDELGLNQKGGLEKLAGKVGLDKVGDKLKKKAGDALGEAGKAFLKARPGAAEGTNERVNANDYADAPKRLDFSVLSGMERFIGARLGDVKIHTGAGASLITKRFHAEAVTIRDHVFFAPGRFQPETTEGRKLIAHELTHVAQRGRPNLDTKTAEAEAHHAEASYGTPGMETLDLSKPKADFHMAGAEHNPNGIRTAKTTRSLSKESASNDDGIVGEDLLDVVGERVYELLLNDMRKDYEGT